MSNFSVDNRGTSAAVADDNVMAVEYRGTQGPLFRLGLVTAILTFLTLGLYRFWAKTRMRKYFWSATAPGGDPFEYTGNGLEKLLGFLIAVAFLAIYLGLLQVILSFAGMSVFSGGDEDQFALQILFGQATFILILPFIFYAQYRARRYILSRTRWRGIRFGVEPAAWGYVIRAIGHTLLTIITLGLLLPRQTFGLEKFRVDRTWYGNVKFEQGGRWTALYRSMKHLFIAAALIIIPTILALLGELPVLFVFTFVGYIWAIYGVVFYQVDSFRVMANEKILGGEIKFQTAPVPSKVFWTYVLGGLLASTCAGLVASAFAIVGVGIMGNTSGFEAAIDSAVEAGGLSDVPMTAFFGLGLIVIGYIGTILMYGVFSLIFVQQPVLEHYVQNTAILNGDALEDIVQRDRDEMVEAEGFADALDVGAAI
ncbi:MAG: DUF898 family protein [Pseudomonadota bacterium]